MKNNRTRFKTIVISATALKRTVKFAAVALVPAVLCAALKLFSITGQQLAFSDDFYKTVISSQMHSDKISILPKKILTAVIGFDICDAKSIMKKYSPIFSEKYAVAQMPAETPDAVIPPQPTPDGEERPIEETKSNGGMKISNRTSIEVNADALADEPLSFTLDKTDNPQILILHTHTTESFTDSDTNKYLTSDSDRNLDESKNIVAVGNKMTEVFTNDGIATIHDTTVHDYPSFNGAYTRAMSTIRANLDAEPSIKVIFDVHRDGIVKEDGTKVKVVTDIDGEKTAQCMFVVGSNALLTHDNWRENMKFACKIQRLANEMYPGLMRPIILREERFNQQASTGSLIIEVGSNGNTLDEAVRGGEKIAKVISKLLKKQ